MDWHDYDDCMRISHKHKNIHTSNTQVLWGQTTCQLTKKSVNHVENEVVDAGIPVVCIGRRLTRIDPESLTRPTPLQPDHHASELTSHKQLFPIGPLKSFGHDQQGVSYGYKNGLKTCGMRM